MDEWWQVPLFIFVGFLVGNRWGQWCEACLWRGKGDMEINDGYRTGMMSAGKMYYVVTEREYVEAILDPRRQEDDQDHPSADH